MYILVHKLVGQHMRLHTVKKEVMQITRKMARFMPRKENNNI